jgi:hypothetical protein
MNDQNINDYSFHSYNAKLHQTLSGIHGIGCTIKPGLKTEYKL